MSNIWPKKKISKVQRNTRHSTRQGLNIKKILNKYTLGLCKNCGIKKLSHRVCPGCGFYGDKQVLTIKVKQPKEKIIDA